MSSLLATSQSQASKLMVEVESLEPQVAATEATEPAFHRRPGESFHRAINGCEKAESRIEVSFVEVLEGAGRIQFGIRIVASF